MAKQSDLEELRAWVVEQADTIRATGQVESDRTVSVRWFRKGELSALAMVRHKIFQMLKQKAKRGAK